MRPRKWSPTIDVPVFVPMNSGLVVVGIAPLAGTEALSDPSMYRRTAVPSYVPATWCQTPVDGSAACAVPRPATSNLNTPPSASRRYWLSLLPFCTTRRLPFQSVALTHADTVIADVGLSATALSTCTYAVSAKPIAYRAIKP